MSNLIKISFVALAVILFSGCKKGFEDLNNDPNNPENVPNSYLLTGAQKGLVDNNYDHWWGGQVGNQLAQYWASNQYSSESRYLYRTGVTNDYWARFYNGTQNDAVELVGGLGELQYIIDRCKADPDGSSTSGDPDNQIAVATILRVWQYQRITDTWGMAPYSEALKGLDNPQPKYDSQEDIYTGLLAEIDDAISKINGGAGPAGDIIYGGDMAKWKAFANSLKIRVAMRLADRKPTITSTKINEAITSGIFTSNDDDAKLVYLSNVPNNNLHDYDITVNARMDFCSANTMVDVLNTMSDPRLGVFYDPAVASGTFVGEVYGLTEGNGAATSNDEVSQRSQSVVGATAPAVLMSYAEVQFLLAEAVERGFISGTASDYYNAGVTASIEWWSTRNVEIGGAAIPGGDITTYLARADVAYATAPGTWQQKIGKQKWIALYNQGLEAWAEWRRLDFGILQMPADGVLDGTGIPLRLKYPLDEQTLNGKNYRDAVTTQGADEQDTRLWWDVH